MCNIILFQTTGLTGLKVVQNPEHHLRVLYNKILRIMKKIPADAAYRKYTETLVQQRLQCIIDVSPVRIRLCESRKFNVCLSYT
jgi:hypothetical protein